MSLYKIEPETFLLRKYEGLPNIEENSLLIPLDSSEEEGDKYEIALHVVLSLAEELDSTPKNDQKAKKQQQAEIEHIVRIIKFDVKRKNNQF